MTGALAKLRAAKGGKPDGGKDIRNRLVVRGCMGRQGPGEKVEGGKTASAGQEVKAGRMEDCLARQSKTGTREENRVRREVQLSIGVADGRGSQYTEGEGGDPENSQTMGRGFKINS